LHCSWEKVVVARGYVIFGRMTFRRLKVVSCGLRREAIMWVCHAVIVEIK